MKAGIGGGGGGGTGVKIAFTRFLHTHRDNWHGCNFGDLNAMNKMETWEKTEKDNSFLAYT